MFVTESTRTLLARLGLVSVVAMAPMAAVAQESAPETPPGAEQTQSFEDETIEAFAAAALKIEEIRTTYTQRFESAESDEQRLQISEEANEQMVAAVEETPGITVEEYNAVTEAAAADPELADRINEELENPEL